MPALVNISVGSLRGTSGEDATAVWPLRTKKSRKLLRISLTPLIRLPLAAPPPGSKAKSPSGLMFRGLFSGGGWGSLGRAASSPQTHFAPVLGGGRAKQPGADG